MLPSDLNQPPGTVTIEIDRLGEGDAVLLTLRTGQLGPDGPERSFLVLGDAVELQELPELVRALCLELVYGDPPAAHQVVWRHLRELAES